MSQKRVPFYKKKFPRGEYCVKGDPVPLQDDEVSYVENWVDLTSEEMEYWEEAKAAVEQKNKKREYLVEFDPNPTKVALGFTWSIEILHKEKRGFVYTATADTEEELNRRFWPTVLKLIAHFFSPKIVGRPAQLT